jgi:hypothetical protein
VAKRSLIGPPTWGFGEEEFEVIGRLMGSRAFQALRGGMSGGAAPKTEISKTVVKARNTVIAATGRAEPKNPDAPFPEGAGPPTPFDLTMFHFFDWQSNGGEDGFKAGMAIVHEHMHMPDRDIPRLIRAALRQTVLDAISKDDRFLTQITAHAAALDYLRVEPPCSLSVEGERERTKNAAWAQWLLAQRRQEWAQTADSYVVLLGVALRLIARRPKAPHTLHDIVFATQSLWAGGVFRCLSDPEAHPWYYEPENYAVDGPIETAMWDLVWGMTEVGVFTAPGDWDNPIERSLVETALENFGHGGRPREVSVAAVAGLAAGRGVLVDTDTAMALFRTDQDLASRCLEYLMGRWKGSEPADEMLEFARHFAFASFPVAEAMLEWLSGIQRIYPSLFRAFEFGPGNVAFDELENFLAAVVTRGPAVAHVESRYRDQARRYLTLAATGGDWREALLIEPRHFVPTREVGE